MARLRHSGAKPQDPHQHCIGGRALYAKPMMRFTKYHALGNDYLVCDPADYPEWPEGPSLAQIQTICHRNFGAGSDGILWGPTPGAGGAFRLRIFNPDGSEAEKSGNGLRIFTRYLFDTGRIVDSAVIETLGGVVTASLTPRAESITIAMGAVSFDSAKVPVALSGPARDVVNEPLHVLDRTFAFSAATIGNPHCVIPLPEISKELACRYGPALETHPLFPNRTNVQFLRVLDRTNIRIEIWERGAGYTLASGSSSSAAASVAHRLGLVDNAVTVHMPGGTIGIQIESGYRIHMTGTVTKVATGVIDPEIFTFPLPPIG